MEPAPPLAPLDVGILVGYLVVVFVAGLVLSRRAAEGIEAYFLGGRRLPWWVLGMSGTASNFDMTGTMVITSFFFAIGLQGFWVAMRGGMVLPLGILIVYMGKWLRRSEVMTNAEWMEIRFGSGAQGRVARLLSAVSNLIVTMAFLVYFVEGTGKFLAIFLPFDATVCSALMLGVALAYTTASGFFGVIWTDVIQEVILVSASLYVGWKAFTLPDHARVMEAAGSRWVELAPRWTMEPMEWLANPDVYRLFGLCIVFWIARGLFEGAGGFTGGYMTQRFFAARDDREAALLSAEWTILLLFRWALVIGTVVLGLALAQQIPEVARVLHADPEKTLPLVLQRAVPAGVRGLLIAGLLAAAMSTFDSTINAGVSYWVKDIYQKHLRPAASERQLMRQSYLGTLAFAAIAVGLAVGVENIDQVWSWITGPLAGGLFVPIVLRWYWWRFNGYGFAIGTGVGLLASIWTQLHPEMPFYLAALVAWVASFVGCIAGSLATPPTDRGTLEAFWRRIRPFGLWETVRRRLPGDEVAEVKRRNGRDLVALPVAIGWHLSGVVAAISLVLRKWSTFGAAGGLFVALSVALYFAWYRHLEPRRLPLAGERGAG